MDCSADVATPSLNPLHSTHRSLRHHVVVKISGAQSGAAHALNYWLQQCNKEWTGFLSPGCDGDHDKLLIKWEHAHG